MTRYVLAAVLTLASLAQAQGLGFAELYGRALELERRNADRVELVAAFARALDAYDSLEPEARSRAELLPAASWCAFQAGEFARAADLARRAMDSAGSTDQLVEVELYALLRGEQVDGALAAARIYADGHSLTVDRFLAGATGLGVAELFKAALGVVRRGGYELGLWYFRQMVRICGERVSDLSNLALSLRFSGREEECRSTYLRALEKAPEDELLWNDYGLFLKGTGHPRDALEAFRRSRACEQPPLDGPAAANIVQLQRLGLDAGIADPARYLADVLATLPNAAFTRRMCIDSILDDD